jgi:sulfur-carrier protein
MAKVTIQYWAAAREAAGVDLESVEAKTLAEALDVIVVRRGDDGRLRSVLATSSFLVDGAAAGRSVAAEVVLHDAAVIEVLPQFAGGLPCASGGPGARQGCAPRAGFAGLPAGAGGQSRRITADWVDNTLEYPHLYVPKSKQRCP